MLPSSDGCACLLRRASRKPPPSRGTNTAGGLRSNAHRPFARRPSPSGLLARAVVAGQASSWPPFIGIATSRHGQALGSMPKLYPLHRQSRCPIRGHHAIADPGGCQLSSTANRRHGATTHSKAAKPGRPRVFLPRCPNRRGYLAAAPPGWPAVRGGCPWPSWPAWRLASRRRRSGHKQQGCLPSVPSAKYLPSQRRASSRSPPPSPPRPRPSRRPRGTLRRPGSLWHPMELRCCAAALTIACLA